jgi:hypothetical protein
MNNDFLFFIKFLAGIVGFGIFTHLIGNATGLELFVFPVDIIFIATMIYLNRNKFVEIISSLEA